MADGLPTLVVTHQLQIERRTGKVRRPETDVLPLCHATNRGELVPEGKTNLDLTEARDSEWQRHQLGHMQVCTSLQTDNHTSTPPHHSVFYRPDALPAGDRHNTQTLTRSHTSTKTRYTDNVFVPGLSVSSIN